MVLDSDYFVRLVPFPTDATGGVTVTNNDGTYSVYINSNLSEERRKEALEHEIAHIVNGDLYKEKDVYNEIETAAGE